MSTLHLDGQLSLTMVSIKLPTFQAEAQFTIKRVTTSMTKFHHCIAALPQDVATRLIDLIRDPTADPYTTLRARLVQIYTRTNFQRYQALKSIPVLTDQRPSSSRTRSSSQGQSTSLSPSSKCWYHCKWGNQANQCRSSSACSFSGN